MTDDAAPDNDIGEVANPAGPEEDTDTPAMENAASTVGRRERKPLNRELWSKAVAAAKAHVEGTDDDDAGELVATGAAAVAETKPADDAKPPEPVKPAGPSPEAIAAWERANLRAAELDKREATLKERESRAGDVAGRFATDPFRALQDLARADLGPGASDQDVADEVSFQITQMSLALAGAVVPKDNVQHELRKLRREVDRRKAAERKADAEAEAKRGESDKAERTTRAIEQIGVEFTQPRKDPAGRPLPPIAEAYKWLAATENPADLLFDVIKREHDRSGTILEIEQAAKLADDYLSEADRSWFTKRKHLLSPTPAPTPADATVPQGDPPTRRSRTLTNADASEDAAPAPVTPGAQLSTEERRRKTIGKWLSKLKEAERD